MPRISVVLPVYNGAAFLEQAVESILSQTYSDFELLALDDGSTDQSRAILERFAAADSRVQVISRPNRGLTATLNEGIELARGIYIARMDADDLALPERFAKQVAYLDAHTETVAVGGQIVLIDNQGRELNSMALPCRHEDIDQRHMNGLSSVLCHPTVMMRTEAVRQVGGYDDRREAAEDFDLWLQLAEIGRLANLDCPVLLYRQHLNSVGYSKRQRQRLSAWEAVRSAAARRGLPFDMPSPEDEPPVPVGSVYRKWGWWALKGGNVGTARHYAWKSLLGAPADKEAWRLLACALRGH